MKASLITCKFLGRPQKKKGKKSSSTIFIINFHSNRQLHRLKRALVPLINCSLLFAKGQTSDFHKGFFAIYSFIRVYYFILLYLVIPQGFYTRCKPIFWKNTAKCTSFFKFFLYHWIIQARNDMGYLWSCLYTLLQSTTTLSWERMDH